MSSTYIVKDNNDNILFVTNHYEHACTAGKNIYERRSFVRMEEWNGAHVIREFIFAESGWEMERDYIEEKRTHINHLRSEIVTTESELVNMMEGLKE